MDKEFDEHYREIGKIFMKVFKLTPALRNGYGIVATMRNAKRALDNIECMKRCEQNRGYTGPERRRG